MNDQSAMDKTPAVQIARMKSSEAFVETLRAQAVTEVFGTVGSALMGALDLFPAAGIRYIPTVHEWGAGHMADRHARVSGRDGVFLTPSRTGRPAANCTVSQNTRGAGFDLGGVTT
jgi:glyoxylate carboligase